MSGFSLDADTLTEIAAALIMFACLWFAVRAAMARRVVIALIWLLPALLAGAVLLFFLTFRIRLM